MDRKSLNRIKRTVTDPEATLRLGSFPVTRWLVGPGYATTPELAARQGIDLTAEGSVVYLRNDGWAIGAGPELRAQAYELWRGQWVAGAILRGGTWQTWSHAAIEPGGALRLYSLPPMNSELAHADVRVG